MCAFSILNGDSLMLMLELLQTFTFINIDAPFYGYPEKSLGLKKTSNSDEINNFEYGFRRSLSIN